MRPAAASSSAVVTPGRTSLRSSRIVSATTAPAALRPARSSGVSADMPTGYERRGRAGLRTAGYDPPRMAVRILLLIAAAGLAPLGASRHSAHGACQDARFDTLKVGLHKLPATEAPGI